MVGKPHHRAVEHSNRGGSGLVVVALGVGEAGVVVDDGVHETSPHTRAVVPVALPGTFLGRQPVLVALGLAHEAPAAAVGDVAELGDVDLDQPTGP